MHLLLTKRLASMFKNVIKNIGTLVVVGKWNVHVFAPEWVKSNLFEGEEMQISVALPTGPYQFRGKSFEITVSENRLHFELLTEEESAKIEVVEALRTILRLLIQTPVTAFGININYLTDADLGNLFPESIQSNANSVGVEIKREVKWSLNKTDGSSTNIRLLEEKDGIFKFDVNYNYIVGKCTDILSLIDDDEIIIKREAECEQMLRDCFNLALVD